jgi:hypothetical protein
MDFFRAHSRWIAGGIALIFVAMAFVPILMAILGV